MKNMMILALTWASMPAMTLAQDAGPQAAPYCSDLKQVVALATTREKFASITGKPREGNFVDTSLTLTGLKDCSLYGPGTYNCDSPELGTAEEAEQSQATMLGQIKACLGETWVEAKEKSSSRYVVLHSAGWPISITLSTDQMDNQQHVVRLILFVRRN
jgi:hypothetical protein